MTGPDQVLQFWFADALLAAEQCAARGEFWFSNNEATDQQIFEVFGDAITDAAAGLYDDWTATPQGRLALIILLDQFPRNIYRGTGEVFRHDAQAIALARQGVQLGQIAGLSVPETAFFLMQPRFGHRPS